MNDSFGLVWGNYSRCLFWIASEEKIKNTLNHFVFFEKNNVDKFSKNYNESFLFYYADYIAYIFGALLAKKADISVVLYMFLDEKKMFNVELPENISLFCIANLFVAVNSVNIYGTGQNLKHMIDLFNYFNISVKHVITSRADEESKIGYKLVRLEKAYDKDISVPIFINSITYYVDIKQNIENFNKNIMIVNLHNL